MMNVSRTPLSESWLTSMPLTPKGQKPFDAVATITLENSRFSVGTMNSDLFPELLAWSAMVEAAQSSPLSQEVPSDIAKGSDIDTLLSSRDDLSISRIFDPTTLEIGFDFSCFDGLDDTLIYMPRVAFAELCWSEGVGSRPPPSPKHDEPNTFIEPTTPRSKPAITQRKRRTHRVAPLDTIYSSSEETDSDSDECRTFREEDDDTVSNPTVHGSDYDLVCVQEAREISSYVHEKALFSDQDHLASSFVHFEHFTSPERKESVGSFPVPVVQPKGVTRRIASFCSSLSFVRPQRS